MTFDAKFDASPQDEFHIASAAVAILDSLQDAILVVDRAGRVHYRNTVAKKNLPPGDDLDIVFHGAEPFASFDGWGVELARVVGTRAVTQFEWALGAGTSALPRMANAHCAPLCESDAGCPDMVLLTVREASRPVELENQLEVSKRLASLGKLATRVAHELNNPLDGILRYINLALRVSSEVPEPRLKSYLAESRIGAMRMVQITGDLLEFSRSTDGEFQETDINELVEQAVRSTASAALDNKVVVTVDFQTQEMPAVTGSRLYQVCCNLIKNAIEAMPEGGQLSVTTGVVQDDVVIRVSDTGIGLPTPPATVFKPFFTTKAVGEGTGLGLAICKDFIEDMNGSIVAEPAIDRGSVFTVRVPISSCHRRSRIAKSLDQQHLDTVDASTEKRNTPEQS